MSRKFTLIKIKSLRRKGCNLLFEITIRMADDWECGNYVAWRKTAKTELVMADVRTWLWNCDVMTMTKNYQQMFDNSNSTRSKRKWSSFFTAKRYKNKTPFSYVVKGKDEAALVDVLKVYEGSGISAPLILNLDNRWRGVTNFLPRERTPVPNEKGTSWASELVRTVLESENLYI